MTRFFVEGVHASGHRVALARDDARKAIVVLRMTDGDPLEIVDSAGCAYSATLVVEGKEAFAHLVDVRARAAERTELAIDLAQAVPKGAKMEYVVEKATELGVRTIIPLRTDRVIGERTGEHKRERWQRLARTAAQQCGRLDIPTVTEIATWETLLPTFAAYDVVLLPWELSEAKPLRATLEYLGPIERALLIIGPEGGLSDDEASDARQSGARTISLGRRILRTETAALVTLAALRYARSEL
jgi:16S rRNA (uracil1498-N3)-methyltransferase